MSDTLKWLSLSWWQYLFERPYGESLSRRVWCRMRNHPAGPVYYNPMGLEPDPRCKNCGEDLG